MDKLKDMGYTLYESEAPDRQLVDFDVSDGEDNVAWVWGDRLDDVDWECSHPEVEYVDDETQGECVLCGSWCDFRYEEDDQGNKVPEPHEWYPRRSPGGLIGEYLKELEAENA